MEASKYCYQVEWSEEDQAFIGTCTEFPGLASQEPDAVAALQQIQSAVIGAIKWLVDEGKEVPEPLSLRKYSGNFVVRVPSSLHRELTIASAKKELSLNQYVTQKLAQPEHPQKILKIRRPVRQITFKNKGQARNKLLEGLSARNGRVTLRKETNTRKNSPRRSQKPSD